MLLAESRRAARTAPDGALVPLAEQDRSRWDGAPAEQGRDLVRRCLRRGRPGPYQVQAAIQAVHSEPPTDWRQVVALYDHLLALTPTPMVALNRAIAVAEADGPATALGLVDALRPALGEHHLFHATRADLLRRLGRGDEAAAAYTDAAARTRNTAERDFLDRRRSQG
jgi:RNA polymerase sigma-70 factor, ECF subfamily